VANLQYNININAGLDHNEEPEISFSMNEETHNFLADIAAQNNITVGEFVATTLMGANFSNVPYVN
jgi:hypothetical protein